MDACCFLYTAPALPPSNYFNERPGPASGGMVHRTAQNFFAAVGVDCGGGGGGGAAQVLKVQDAR